MGAQPEKLSEDVDSIYRLEVPCSVIDQLCHDPDALQALEQLEIARDDQYYLSDILDPDHGGSIQVIELIEGLGRLRGRPRRSNIICVDLMLRSIQVTLQ